MTETIRVPDWAANRLRDVAETYDVTMAEAFDLTILETEMERLCDPDWILYRDEDRNGNAYMTDRYRSWVVGTGELGPVPNWVQEDEDQIREACIHDRPVTPQAEVTTGQQGPDKYL